MSRITCPTSMMIGIENASPKSVLAEVAEYAWLITGIEGCRRKTVPGQYLMSLPSEIRSRLSELKSDDIKNCVQMGLFFDIALVSSRERSSFYHFRTK